MLVWLASYPRSGNTFFRVLLKHWYDTPTFSIHGDPVLRGMGADEAVGHTVMEGSLEDLARSSDVSFVKTHELPSDDTPAVYLVRDGRDAVVSHARYRISFINPRKLPQQGKFEAVLKDVITNEDHYGGWGKHVMSWTGRGNVALVRYEDLITDPLNAVTKAIEDLDLHIERASDEAPSFEELHAKWPKFFRKGQTGAWREEMPKRLHRLFWRHHGEAMDMLGYPK